MAHKKIIDSVKKQGQVTIKDLDEFLRFVINEYDIRFSTRGKSASFPVVVHQEALLSESLMTLSLQTVFHSKSCSY